MKEELAIGTEPEAKDEVPFGRTGFFRDGTRRIDLVLVVKDDANLKREAIVIDFLTNVLKFGLCLELEPGLMVYHRNLVFIKVHAPESLIEEYGRKFEVRRYFKQNHIEFANPKGFIRRLLSYIDYTGLYEKEWVKLVRRKYPPPKRYSTIERSTIVNKLLQNLPFGDHENYVGYDRLLRAGIILDAFPLHDGPYFAVPGQFPAEYNARQILNYNWAGLGNLLKLQPLNLVHEYFGDRLAFFFAFYGFYTYSLIIPAIISTDAILPELRKYNISKGSFGDAPTLNDYLPMCPTCTNLEACRFVPYKYLEDAKKIAEIFNQEDIFVIMIYIVIWATLFVLFWRRKEYYWMWMWECKPEIPARTVRTEYIPDKEALQGKDKSILYTIYKDIATLFLCLLTVGCYLLFWVLFAVGLILLQERLLIIFNPLFKFGYGYGHYKVPMIFYSVYLFVIIVFDKVWSFASYMLTNLQNHRTESDYENSLTLKLFGFTYAFTCTLFFYLAFFKQQFITNPYDPAMYEYMGIFMTFCNLSGCSDELAISLFFIIITRDCVFKVISHVYALFFMRTDYNQGRAVNSNVPSWEREYTLTPVNDAFVIDKMKGLAIQFGLSVGFICGCPLTLCFIVCVNLLDIRLTARRLVKGCRRPLLQSNLGLGSWKNVFIILIFATLIINSLILTLTKNNFRYQHELYQIRKCAGLVFYKVRFPKPFSKEIDRLASENVMFLKMTDYCFFPAVNHMYILVPSNKLNHDPGWNLCATNVMLTSHTFVREIIVNPFGRVYSHINYYNFNSNVISPERNNKYGKNGTIDYDQHISWYRQHLAALYFNKIVSTTALAVVFLFYVIPPNQVDIERTKAIEKEIIEGN